MENARRDDGVSVNFEQIENSGANYEVSKTHLNSKARISDYYLISKFKSLILAREYLKKANKDGIFWKQQDKYITNKGQKIRFNCQSCFKKCYLICHNHTERVSLFENIGDHKHDEPNGKRDIETKIKSMKFRMERGVGRGIMILLRQGKG